MKVCEAKGFFGEANIIQLKIIIAVRYINI